MIAVVAASVIVGLAIRNIFWGVLAIAFLMPFTPRPIALSLGGLALTSQRMWAVTLCALFLAALAVDRRLQARIGEMLRTQQLPCTLLATLFGIKLAAVLIHAHPGSLPYLVDDVLLSTFLFVLAYVAVRTSHDLVKVMAIMTLALLLTLAISMVELASGQVLLQSLTNETLTGVEENVRERIRGGVLRVRALFTSALQLSEYAVLTLPFALFLMLGTRGKMRLLGWLGVIAVPAIIVVSGARSGILVGIAVFAVFFMALNWPRLSRPTKGIMIVFLTSLIGAALWTAAGVIVTLGSSGTEQLWRIESNENRSSLVRAAQYVTILSEINRSPLLGFGIRQNFANELDFVHTIDNYWLRLLLEGGYLAFATFAALLIVILRLQFTALNRAKDRPSRLVMAALIAFTVGFILKKLFLSVPHNNPYFFLMTGAFAAVLATWNRERAKTASAYLPLVRPSGQGAMT